MTVTEAVALYGRLEDGVTDQLHGNRSVPEVIVCPPFVALTALNDVADERLIKLAAQNCHWESEGPYTGQISLRMLNGLVEYVLLGHPEHVEAGETEEQIAKKIPAAATAGLRPVVFVGEKSPSDVATRQVELQLRNRLTGVNAKEHSVIVVYEPEWATDANEPAEPQQIEEVTAMIKQQLTEMGHPDPEVVYAGAVNSDNTDRLADVRGLDGLVLGEASLDDQEVLRILERIGAR